MFTCHFHFLEAKTNGVSGKETEKSPIHPTCISGGQEFWAKMDRESLSSFFLYVLETGSKGIEPGVFHEFLPM